MKLNRIGKVISHENAAEIIGKHFSNVQDKLLNTLQLHSLAETSTEENELLIASINQKSEKLEKVPFSNAIDFSKSYKYIYFAIPPLFILLSFLFLSPKLITESGKRLINHNTYFSKPVPFTIGLENDELSCIQNENYTLNIVLDGKILPDQVFVVANNRKLKMQKIDKTHFTYVFQAVQKSFNFYFEAANYEIGNYHLKVLLKPILLNFTVEIKRPDYTRLGRESLSNIGDFSVPLGSVINWTIYARDANAVKLTYDSVLTVLQTNKQGKATFSKNIMHNSYYSLSMVNDFMTNSDSISFFINSIPDLYPNIQVEVFNDSINDNILYFRGLIRDDYGFSSLKFNYKLNNNDKSDLKSLPITINNGINEQNFYYMVDIFSLNIEKGDDITYFFEVWDNDGINGSKPAKSANYTFHLPSLEEVNKLISKNSDNLKSDLEKSLAEAQKLKEELMKLAKGLFEKKELSYQDKQQIKNLLEKQKKLYNEIEKLSNKNELFNKKESSFNEFDDNIVEKQKKIEDLFKDVMSEDVRKILENLENLLNDVKKEDVNDMIDKMRSNMDLFEDKVDRNLELFKQLEFDKNLSKSIENILRLSEKQKELSKETMQQTDTQSLLDKQGAIKKEFNDIEKALKELEKLNNSLEKPTSYKNPVDKQQNIDNQINTSQKQLNESNKKGASKSQQNAAEAMDELGNDLLSMQSEIEKENDAEDAEAMRNILENLVTTSFDQEDLIKKLSSVTTKDPQFLNIIELQKRIDDNLAMVKDSLIAVSKRQLSVESFITTEVNKISDYSELCIKHLVGRNTYKSQENQQYIMTSVNNLALMVAESLKKIENNMRNSKSSCNSKNSKSCNNPNNSGSKSKKMSDQQKDIQHQMEQMRRSLENQGKKEQGKSPQGKQSISEQLARMAAQQSALRKQLQEYRDQLQKEGNLKNSGLNEAIQKMEETEKDIVNKKITKESVERQQQILTRLLESEKAQMDRDQEEKRVSNEAKQIIVKSPKEFFLKRGQKINDTELLKTIPSTFTPYYKNKANEYFLRLSESDK